MKFDIILIIYPEQLYKYLISHFISYHSEEVQKLLWIAMRLP